MLHAVIMAGGSGTRFWPASRSARPKQLLDLAGDQTMIQSTISRLAGLVPNERVLVVTNQRLVEPIRAQLSQLPSQSIVGEPCKRDTAPCVGLAAAWVSREDPDAIMAVMPADHVIQPNDIFQRAVKKAARLVQQNPKRLVTFGIKPAYASESFGYIERGESLDDGAYRVKQFREKPRREVAEEYLAAGTFYWNSGIFVWRAQTILDLLAQHEPTMFAHLEKIAAAMGTAKFQDVLQSEFERIQGTSIDYAVMERADEVAVIEAQFDWDDVGNWQSLQRLHGTDDQANTLVGNCLAVETEGSILRGQPGHLVAAVGMKDCIIVHTENATLVANKHDEESVRKIVKVLEDRGWKEFL